MACLLYYCISSYNVSKGEIRIKFLPGSQFVRVKVGVFYLPYPLKSHGSLYIPSKPAYYHTVPSTRLLSEVGQVKRTCEALLCGPPSPSLAQQYYSPEIIRLTPPLHVAEDEVSQGWARMDE